MDDTAKIWIVDDEPSVRFPIYTRGNAGEVFPNVVTPLTGSLFAEASVTAQTALFLELGFIVPSDLEDGAAPLTGVFGGYLYLNLSIGRLAGARSPGLTPDAIDTQLYGTYGAPPYVRQRGDRNLVATARILRGLVRMLRRPDVGYVDDVMREAVAWVASLPDITAASDRALLDLVPTFPARIERLFVALLRASTLSGTGRGIAEELLKRSGDAVQLVNRLTAGLGTIESALPAQRLWDLGRLVAADEGLTAAFDDGVPGVGERIRGLRSDAANAFELEFESFLAAHGHRGPDEYEFASPTWGTRPRSRSPRSIACAALRPNARHASHRNVWRSNVRRRSPARCERCPDPSGRCCVEGSRRRSSVPRHASGRRTRSSASSPACGPCSTSWRPAPRPAAVRPCAATATWSPPGSWKRSSGIRPASPM